MRLFLHPRAGIARTCACLLLWSAGMGCAPSADVPAALIGTWTTDAPRYQGRHLSITPTTIAFGTGPLAVDVHTLSGIEVAPDPEGGTRYTLRFLEPDGAEASLDLHALGQAADTLRISNRDEIWRRAPDAAGSEESG